MRWEKVAADRRRMVAAGATSEASVIRLTLGAADINRVLSTIEDARIVFQHGHFVIEKTVGPVGVVLHAHLDLGPGRLRVAVPFEQVRSRRGAKVVGSIVATAWRWLASRIEAILADQLSRAGLPWDMVWVDQFRDDKHGLVGTVDLSPRMLNDWLGRQTAGLPFGLRLAELAISEDNLTVGVALLGQDGATAVESQEPVLASQPPSQVHLSAEAINAVLQKAVCREGELDVQFRDGRFVVQAEGLTMVVDELSLSPEGLDVRLRLG